MTYLPRRIDTHQHIIPPSYADLLNRQGIRPGGIDLPQWSRDAALRMMDRQHIQTGIVSVSTPGALLAEAVNGHLDEQQVREVRRIARSVNEFAAELVDGDPYRFGFFATLTLPDVEGALAEVDYAFDELHADGVVLLANSAGRYLGDAEFEPLLDRLDQRAAVVFIHPGELPAEAVPGIPSFTADFLLDTVRTALSLIISGAMERFRKIKFILAHAGGFLPYIDNRVLLTLLQQGGERTRKIGGFVSEHSHVAAELAKHHYLAPLKRFYWDTALSTSAATLSALQHVADPSHITFGSDWPFAPQSAVSFTTSELEHYPLNKQMRAAIDHGNALFLFPRLGL